MPKKEALLINRELTKLERNLRGIRDMDKLPDTIFVLDTKKEHIAVTEARKVGVPIVAVVDTNCDPDLIDYAIPGNDDAIRAGQLMCRVISDAVQEGRFIRSKRVEVVDEPPCSDTTDVDSSQSVDKTEGKTVESSVATDEPGVETIESSVATDEPGGEKPENLDEPIEPVANPE